MNAQHFRIYRIYRHLSYVFDWQTLDMLTPMCPAVQQLRPVNPTYQAVKHWRDHSHSHLHMDQWVSEKISVKG